MRKKHVIYLNGYEESENDIGDIIQIPTSRKILAEKKSVRQSEHYQADAVGAKPEIVFKVWLAEYKEESSLKYNKRDYKIIRTYSPDEKNIELVCEGLVNRGAGNGST